MELLKKLFHTAYIHLEMQVQRPFVYIVMETNSSLYVRLLGSKTRVAPLVKHSIPRLELLSALIVARLFFSIKAVLQSLISFGWTVLQLSTGSRANKN